MDRRIPLQCDLHGEPHLFAIPFGPKPAVVNQPALVEGFYIVVDFLHRQNGAGLGTKNCFDLLCGYGPVVSRAPEAIQQKIVR